MKKLLLGIDVGTTHIKAGLFDLSGRQEALSIQDNNVHHGKNGFSYYNPLEIKTTVFDVVSHAVRKIKYSYEILGISVASMAEAGVPIDRYGDPLYDIITWYDMRTKVQANWWKENMDPYEIYDETGLILQPKYSLNKIMWIKENHREIYDKTRAWLCMEDYIIYCLTDALATDYSMANRTMAMDIKSGTWSDRLLDMAGIRKDIFPQIHGSGTVVGTVTKEASKIAMVKEGTPVVTGGHDHMCAALSMGVHKEGDVFDSMGTAETLVAVRDSMETGRDKFEAGFSTGRYVSGDKFYISGGLQNSGGSIEWFGKNFIDKDDFYGELKLLSSEMDSMPSGILYLPHLRGGGAPNKNPFSKGAFIGLRSEHTNAHIIKSIYEGTAYELRTMKDSLEEMCSMRIENLKITGGCTKNDVWMGIKANVLGMDIDIPRIEESAAMGAAILSGIGVGVYSSIEDALENIKVSHEVVKYDEGLSQKYDFIYKNAYKNLYSILKPVNEVLSGF